ncbi:hypothetical protein [Roseibium sp. Sym1]|uniref:hypothetical protein n=1 Tax=Roseibium sp. Sym1 TaxID=3016006 RepID=UPI0022B4F598|nr:hypothetical protein [Roseibium sp. Sym1]
MAEEQFSLLELSLLVLEEAERREASFNAKRNLPGFQPDRGDMRDAKMWRAAARALEIASFDPDGFRDFCRSVLGRAG